MEIFKVLQNVIIYFMISYLTQSANCNTMETSLYDFPFYIKENHLYIMSFINNGKSLMMLRISVF